MLTGQQNPSGKTTPGETTEKKQVTQMQTCYLKNNNNNNKDKGTPPWGGCGFSTLCTWWLNQKSPFLHCNLQYFMFVIYDVLTFAARCQNAKKNFCNSATSAWGSMHSFFPQCSFSRHSSFWRACPKSGCIDAGVQIKIAMISHRSLAFYWGVLCTTSPPPLPVKVARRQQQSWATCLR